MSEGESLKIEEKKTAACLIESGTIVSNKRFNWNESEATIDSSIWFPISYLMPANIVATWYFNSTHTRTYNKQCLNHSITSIVNPLPNVDCWWKCSFFLTLSLALFLYMSVFVFFLFVNIRVDQWHIIIKTIVSKSFKYF